MPNSDDIPPADRPRGRSAERPAVRSSERSAAHSAQPTRDPGTDRDAPPRAAARRGRPPRDDDPINAYLDRLPRGRHGLDRDTVGQSQRGRLITSLVELAAINGYDAVSILDIVSRAGTSKRTFYEHFSDKEDCLIQAFDIAHATLIERTMSRIVGIADTADRLAAGMRAYIETIIEMPEYAQLFLNESMAAGPRLAERWEGAIEAFAEAVRARREISRVDDATLPPLSKLHVMLVAAGVNHLLGMTVRRHGVEAVADQADDLAELAVRLLTAPPSRVRPAPSPPPRP